MHLPEPDPNDEQDLHPDRCECSECVDMFVYEYLWDSHLCPCGCPECWEEEKR